MTIKSGVAYASTSDNFAYRPGTADEWVLREAAYGRLLRQIQLGSRVLDLGGYIGSFAARAAKRGAVVLSVEASPANYAVLQVNASRFNFETMHAAVVPHEHARDVTHLPFYVSSNEHGHPYCRLLWKHDYTEVQVPLTSIGRLQRDFKPNYVKIDIEGLECEIIAKLDLSTLAGLAVEYELHTRGQRVAAIRTDDYLRAAGVTTAQMRVDDQSWKTRSTVKTYLR